MTPSSASLQPTNTPQKSTNIPPTEKIPDTQIPQGFSTQSFLVLGTSYWYDTGIVIKSNQEITIEVISGGWSIDGSKYQLVDGKGHVSLGQPPSYYCWNSCYAPSDDTLAGTLVARIGNDVIVIRNRKVISKYSGRLSLMINDLYDSLGDNSGYLNVRVSISGD